MASRGHTMFFFETGQRLLPRLDAIDEVPRVGGQQVIVSLHPHRLAPQCRLWVRHNLRAAHGFATELGDLILGRDLHVRDYLETRTAKGHTSLSAKELQPFTFAPAAARLPVRPECR